MSESTGDSPDTLTVGDSDNGVLKIVGRSGGAEGFEDDAEVRIGRVGIEGIDTLRLVDLPVLKPVEVAASNLRGDAA